MIKKDIDNKYFKQPVRGTDPITKGHFTIDWAFVMSGWVYDNSKWGEKDIETLSAIGQITIDGNDTNPFYDALVKTPLLTQDHPLSVEFKDGTRFIKITKIGKWASYAWDELDKTEKGRKIVLGNVEFDFLNNLNYLEDIQDYKNQNLL